MFLSLVTAQLSTTGEFLPREVGHFSHHAQKKTFNHMYISVSFLKLGESFTTTESLWFKISEDRGEVRKLGWWKDV